MNDLETLSALSAQNPFYPYILFYVSSINRFMTHDWVIVHDISEIIDAWQIRKWKRDRQDAPIRIKDGTEMMVYYLNEEEDEDVLEYLDWNESFGLKGDRNYI